MGIATFKIGQGKHQVKGCSIVICANFLFLNLLSPNHNAPDTYHAGWRWQACSHIHIGDTKCGNCWQGTFTHKGAPSCILEQSWAFTAWFWLFIHLQFLSLTRNADQYNLSLLFYGSQRVLQLFTASVILKMFCPSLLHIKVLSHLLQSKKPDINQGISEEGVKTCLFLLCRSCCHTCFMPVWYKLVKTMRKKSMLLSEPGDKTNV